MVFGLIIELTTMQGIEKPPKTDTYTALCCDWPLSTNTMGIKTTDFILLVKNLRDEMLLLSRGRNDPIDSCTREEIESNSYLIVCMLKVRTKEQQKLTTSWPQVLLSLFQRYQVEVTCTPPQCLEAGLAGFKLEQQFLMSLFGHSEMGGTRTVCQQHEMCCFKECYQVLQGYRHQKPKSAQRG